MKENNKRKTENGSVALTCNKSILPTSNEVWFIDSGVTAHFKSNLELLQKFNREFLVEKTKYTFQHVLS